MGEKPSTNETQEKALTPEQIAAQEVVRRTMQPTATGFGERHGENKVPETDSDPDGLSYSA